MAEPISAYPLTWPSGWPRTPAARRRDGRFTKRVRPSGSNYAHQQWLTTSDGLQRVLVELERMGI